MTLEKYEYYRNENGVLYCGKMEEVLPLLPKADLCLTDPPYGLKESRERALSRRRKSDVVKMTDYGSFDWDSKPATKEQIQACIASAERSIIWGGNYFHVPPARGWFVWDKLNSGDFADCELAWTNLETAVRIFRHLWSGMLRASWKGKPRLHPTQKPTPLFMWCIQKTTARTVVDPFAGSCTTAIACERLGRKWIGIEISEKYCEVAKKRIEAERQQLRMF